MELAVSLDDVVDAGVVGGIFVASPENVASEGVFVGDWFLCHFVFLCWVFWGTGVAPVGIGYHTG